LAAVNPGINTIELRLGVGWFTHARGAKHTHN
jgi:hypothetical protein